MIEPSERVINGEGRPRILSRLESPVYTSSLTTVFGDDRVSESDGAVINITGLSYSNSVPYAVVVTAPGIDVYEGDLVIIANNVSVTGGNINGEQEVIMRIDANIFLFAFGPGLTFGAGAKGDAQRNFEPEELEIIAGMLIESIAIGVDEEVEELVYAKITEVVDQTIFVDEWIGGKPANGTRCRITGYIADLPSPKKNYPEFTPDSLVHKLWKSRKEVEEYGYFVKLILDFSHLFYGDNFYDLRHALNKDEGIVQTVIIPRRDVPSISYNVIMSPDTPMKIVMRGQGRSHKDFIMVFEGSETVADMIHVIAGYGSGYGDVSENGW